MALRIVQKALESFVTFSTKVVDKTPSLKGDFCSRIWQGFKRSSTERAISPILPESAKNEIRSATKFILGTTLGAGSILIHGSFAPACIDLLPRKLLEEKIVCDQFAQVVLERMETLFPQLKSDQNVSRLVEKFLVIQLGKKLNQDPVAIFNQGATITISVAEWEKFLGTQVKSASVSLSKVPYCTIQLPGPSFTDLLRGDLQNLALSIT